MIFSHIQRVGVPDVRNSNREFGFCVLHQHIEINSMVWYVCTSLIALISAYRVLFM